MTIEYYSSPTERETLKTAANLRGESTIHDDFVDVNDNSTTKEDWTQRTMIKDGKVVLDPTDVFIQKGRLEFGIIPDPPPDPDRDRAQELTEKFETDGTLSPTELIEFVRLKLVKGK